MGKGPIKELKELKEEKDEVEEGKEAGTHGENSAKLSYEGHSMKHTQKIDDVRH